MSSTAHESWRVRVCDQRGEVHGAGVLVTHEHVLTCAHVVASAVGADAAGPCPRDSVVVDFPGSSSDISVPATPLPAAWAPVHRQRGDVAVLTLRGQLPPEVQPAALRVCGSSYPSNVRAFGHPRGGSLGTDLDIGRWITADLLGTGGPGAEWIQMVGDHVTGGAVDGGFSGAGVVTEDGAVVGCVIAYDVEIRTKIAWMVPVEVIAVYWHQLHALIQPSSARQALTVVERHRLITLLYAVQEMRNPGARDTYIGQLKRQYSRLVINRHQDDLEDIGAIVDGCMREPGALHDLLYALENHTWSQADAEALARLREALSILLPAPLLRRDEREHLLTLLDPATTVDIADSFRGAVAPFGDPATGWTQSPVAAVGELEARNTAPDSVPPLIDFAERVAVRLRQPHRSELRRWSDRITARLGVRSSTILLLRARLDIPAESSARPAYFVTRLQPDGIDPSLYLLTIWLQHGASPGIPVRQQEVALAVAEIKHLVNESFSNAAAYAIEEVGLLTLEFVLPSALLGLPVDQWQIGTSSLPHGIGVDHPVLVRSLDRHNALSFQDPWRRNDVWLRQHDVEPCEPALMWVAGRNAVAARQMYARLVGPVVGEITVDCDSLTLTDRDQVPRALQRAARIP